MSSANCFVLQQRAFNRKIQNAHDTMNESELENELVMKPAT
jgi:hypothetical protein